MYPVTRFRQLSRNRALQVSAIILLLLAAAYLWLGREAPVPAPGTPEPSTGFTFFGIGPDTRLTEAVRADLQQRLGNAVDEQWSDIDLTINYKGFLADHFPVLDELNRRLKDEWNIDVGEHPIRLTFRHTRTKETPFSYVELTFAADNRKPLMFRIRPKREGPEILETLREKYGPPRSVDWDDRITWDGKQGRSHYWTLEGDILILSVTPDRYGNPAYRLAIYYVRNLSEALERKLERERRRGPDTDRAVKNAF